MPPDGDLCTCFACENDGANGDHHISPDPNCTHCRKCDPSPSSFYYSSSLGYVSAPLSDSEKLRRVVTASIKGFTIGAGLKGGLTIFSILARLRRRKLLASLRTEGVITNNEAIVTHLFRWTRLLFGTAKWRALVAGAIAGPSMLLTGLNMQHTSLAIYILLRAAVLASQCGIKSKRFGGICKPLTWPHGDIFLMCLSSSQIREVYLHRTNPFSINTEERIQ